MHIRSFHINDLEALIDLAQVSLSTEYMVTGSTPESFMQQIRFVTRGRMIPFRLISALSGYKWELFVAEVDNLVVGSGSYVGKQQIELANLMVHPDYQRRGIGQALLIKRLDHLRMLGYPYVTTTVRANNKASLSNLDKQDFEIFDQYAILEVPTRLLTNAGATYEIQSRSLTNTDLAHFQKMESEWATPLWLQIEKTASHNYFRTKRELLIARLTGTQYWNRAFIQRGRTVGYLTVTTGRSQSMGHIMRPVIPDDESGNLPFMLTHAAAWLETLGKTSMRMAIATTRPALLSILLEQGWQKSQTMIRLVKWLNK